MNTTHWTAIGEIVISTNKNWNFVIATIFFVTTTTDWFILSFTQKQLKNHFRFFSFFLPKNNILLQNLFEWRSEESHGYGVRYDSIIIYKLHTSNLIRRDASPLWIVCSVYFWDWRWWFSVWFIVVPPMGYCDSSKSNCARTQSGTHDIDWIFNGY